MTPEEIRAEAIERIARAFYEAEAADELATTGKAMPSWDRLNKSHAHAAIQDARLAVDALGDLLPIAVEWGARIGREEGVTEMFENDAQRRPDPQQRYVTGWHGVTE